MADQLESPALDPMTVEPVVGTNYPPPFAEACAARKKRRVGNALGLRNFGVNNRTAADVVYLEVGDRPPVDDVDYPDIDMLVRGGRFVHRDGTPY